MEAEVRLRRFDGEYRWMRSTAAPRFREHRQFMGFVGCAMDITDIKRSEETLKEADRRKDEFLATLAHELRNPLAPIRYSLHLLRTDPTVEGNASRILEMMDRQVRQMDRLVDDLLEISRIALGRIELRRERVDLASIVHAALETSAPIINAAGHHLTLELPEESLLLEVDPVRLAQVFANLLNNAAQYTDPGGAICLAARREGARAVVTVADNGVGLSREMLSTLFDRADRPTRQLGGARGGLGIGLTVVKRLVEMHDGRVTVSSDGPGKGCVFEVALPLAPPAPQVSAASRRPSIGSLAKLPPRRVLVADDNRDAADSLTALLESLGLEVRAAYDGASALEQTLSFHPAVALLDIGMPDLDGYEVARRIRANSAYDDVLLVAVTGWGHPAARRKSREAGFDHHLVKPVAFDVLRTLLLASELTPAG